MLVRYCEANRNEQDRLAEEIEKTAKTLLQKKRGPRTTASNFRSPKRQTVALLSRVTKPRLGSRIDDFRSAWGSPLREEVLGRTATFVWRPRAQSNEAFPSSIFNVEVSFLDQIACQIILRSKHSLRKADLVKLGETLVPLFQSSDLATLHSESDGGRTYQLSSGGYLIAWAKENPAVVVLRSDLFLHNEELFDEEAAKVRPPTSNH